MQRKQDGLLTVSEKKTSAQKEEKKYFDQKTLEELIDFLLEMDESVNFVYYLSKPEIGSWMIDILLQHDTLMIDFKDIEFFKASTSRSFAKEFKSTLEILKLFITFHSTLDYSKFSNIESEFFNFNKIKHDLIYWLAHLLSVNIADLKEQQKKQYGHHTLKHSFNVYDVDKYELAYRQEVAQKFAKKRKTIKHRIGNNVFFPCYGDKARLLDNQEIRIMLQALQKFIKTRRLQQAAATNDVEKIKLLLANLSINPNANDHLALKIATMRGYNNAIKCFLDSPRLTHIDYDFLLRTAIYFNHLPTVQLLLSEQPFLTTELNANSNELLLVPSFYMTALCRGNNQIIACLKAANMKPYKYDYMAAASVGNLAFMKYCLDENVDLHMKMDFFALQSAVHEDHLDIVEFLFEQNRVLSHYDYNKLFSIAARHSCVKVVEFFLKRNCINPFYKFEMFPDGSWNGWKTGMGVAAHYGHLEIIGLILDYMIQRGDTIPSSSFYRNFIELISYSVLNAARQDKQDVIDFFIKDKRIPDEVWQEQGKNRLAHEVQNENISPGARALLLNNPRLSVTNLNWVSQDNQENKSKEYIENELSKVKKAFFDSWNKFRLFQSHFYQGASGLSVLKSNDGKCVEFFGFPPDILENIQTKFFAQKKRKKEKFPAFMFDYTKKLPLKRQKDFHSCNKNQTIVFFKFTTREEARKFIEKYPVLFEQWKRRFPQKYIINQHPSKQGYLLGVPVIDKRGDYFYKAFYDAHPELPLLTLNQFKDYEIEIVKINPSMLDKKITCINQLEEYIWSNPQSTEVELARKMISYLEDPYKIDPFMDDDFDKLTKGALGEIISGCEEAKCVTDRHDSFIFRAVTFAKSLFF